ncbi:response regulator [Planosporangium sp. 12N6]|uniref:response regulator n=1 Tax=Planosporangium spinosum TaxID=3402278 RepID=UPI003CE801B5
MRTAVPRSRLLLVDHDVRVRAALTALLSAVPEFEVVGSCGNATDAWSAVASTRPHLVLLDLLLPMARDGLALVARLRGAGIPVVAMSIRGGLRAGALARGAVAFLEKDGSADALVAALLAAAPGGHDTWRRDK